MVRRFSLQQKVKGRENMKSIKRYLPKNIKIALMRIHCLFILFKPYFYPASKPRCFVFMTPQFGNIGDQAIAQAQYEFLSVHLPEYQIIEIPFRYLLYARKYFIEKVKPRDRIVLHGGGNIGTIWPEFEAERLEIIKSFPDNRIISFPQSVFFSDDDSGAANLKRSAETYASHKDLHLIAREKYSYETLKNACLGNVYLAPDIVFYLDKTKPSYPRQGALMCFREDKEKRITADTITQIDRCVKKYTGNITYTDTVVEKRILISQRDRFINQKLDQFKRTKLVLTDRLHGLVFAAITATPCIAFGNNYHKVKGIYEWVRHLNYIKFCEDESEIQSCIDYLWGLEKCLYDNSQFISEFDIICEVLKDS